MFRRMTSYPLRPTTAPRTALIAALLAAFAGPVGCLFPDYNVDPGGTAASQIDKVLCGEEWVDVKSDPAHCGECNNSCGEATCVDGGCDLPSACGAGEVQCPINPEGDLGPCTDLSDDPKNCGECANACDAGIACVGGACAAPSECGAGEIKCVINEQGDLGPCIDIASDPDNCGACGYTCGEGAVCVSGNCTDPGCEVAGQSMCGSECKDLSTDPNNCGWCGHGCQTPTTCIDGQCVAGASP